MGKNRLFSCIIALLLFLAGNWSVYGDPVTDHVVCRGTYSSASLKKEQCHPAFNRHSSHNERIKIRYKGGESPGFLLDIPIILRTVVLADPITRSHYVSFFVSRHFNLFSLRGPPVV